MSDRVALAFADYRAEIAPSVGGAIVRLAWREIDLLRKTPAEALAMRNVRQMASYPLVPYSNRIGHAAFRLGEAEYRLRPNFPGEPHAIHGVGWQRAWTVARSTGDSVVLALKHAADADWPFRFEAEQRIALSEHGLEVSLRATSLDEQPMPVGLGFHPFFPIDTHTTLEATWTGMWEMGGDKLPTQLIAVPSHADYRPARKVFDWKIDHCFVGWPRKAVLRYAAHTVTLTATAGTPKIVCFAPNDGRHFIALEPVSHINNAFQLAARGVKDTGMRLLGRGDSFEIGMRIAASRG